MTYLKRAIMEHPDMDPKALVLFHCPFDFDLPLTACPDMHARNSEFRIPNSELSPPTLCYLCWNLEVPE